MSTPPNSPTELKRSDSQFIFPAPAPKGPLYKLTIRIKQCQSDSKDVVPPLVVSIERNADLTLALVGELVKAALGAAFDHVQSPELDSDDESMGSEDEASQSE